MRKRYCIQHGKMEMSFTEDKIDFHFNGGGICEGPFAECPPPVLPDGWENTVEEPGSDELFVMNVRARQLLAELEG